MTQRHYLESIRNNQDLDEQFKSLLRHHWMEEAQHAKLDTLMIEELAAGLPATEIAKAIDGYLDLGGLIDGGLKQQVEFDLDALARVTGKELTAAQSEELAKQQHQAQRWTYIGSGISHPNFLVSVGALDPAARERLVKVAPAFC